MSIWKSPSILGTPLTALLSRISQESKYPEDVWAIDEDPSSLAFVLCVSRQAPDGEWVRRYQKVARNEVLKKPDIIACIARSMTTNLTSDFRRVVRQREQMPLHHKKMEDPRLSNPYPEPVEVKFNKLNSYAYWHEGDKFEDPLDELRIKVSLWLTPLTVTQTRYS